jgi:hypothetical protein
MTITRTQMVAEVRNLLADLDASDYTWTDARVGDAVDYAVRQYSLASGRPQSTTLATTAGSRELAIASLTDLVEVDRVEWPVGSFPPEYVQFSIWGTTLTLLTPELPDGSTCKVWWTGLHTLDDTTQTPPARHEHILELGAAGYAAVWEASKRVDAANEGGDAVAGRWLSWGEARLREFERELRRIGRGEVRARRLYRPALPSMSQSRDPGP